nr:Chain Q, Adhesion G-protein coupled receptor G6 [Danio rerio]
THFGILMDVSRA